MHHALLGFGVDLQLPRLGWGFSDGLLDRVILVRLSVSPIRGFASNFRMEFSSTESIILLSSSLTPSESKKLYGQALISDGRIHNFRNESGQRQ